MKSITTTTNGKFHIQFHHSMDVQQLRSIKSTTTKNRNSHSGFAAGYTKVSAVPGQQHAHDELAVAANTRDHPTPTPSILAVYP
jgi:hypothetical protein